MKRTFKKFWKFFLKWNEFITIPLGILLWIFSTPILRFFDSTAATYDSGIFQIILFTLIQFFIYHGIAWFMIKVTFPSIDKYMDNVFEDLMKGDSMTDYQKVTIIVWILTIYIGAFVFLSRIL